MKENLIGIFIGLVVLVIAAVPVAGNLLRTK